MSTPGSLLVGDNGGEVQVARVEGGRATEGMLQDGGLAVVDPDLGGHSEPAVEAALMAGQEVFHALGQGELKVEFATVGQNHHEEAQAAAGRPDLDPACRTPVHLGALPRQEVQGLARDGRGRAELSHQFLDDGVAALEARLTQALEDLPGRIRMLVEPSDDVGAVGIEFGFPGALGPGFESLDVHPFGDRALVEIEELGDLGLGKAVGLKEPTDFVEGLIIDHWAPPITFWRMAATESPAAERVPGSVASEPGSRSSTW